MPINNAVHLNAPQMQPISGNIQYAQWHVRGSSHMPINNAVHLNAPHMLPISGNIQYAQVNISIFKRIQLFPPFTAHMLLIPASWHVRGSSHMPINNAVHLNAPQMLPISGNIQYAQVNISIFKRIQLFPPFTAHMLLIPASWHVRGSSHMPINNAVHLNAPQMLPISGNIQYAQWHVRGSSHMPINNAVHLNAPQMLPISGNIQYAQVNISIFKRIRLFPPFAAHMLLIPASWHVRGSSHMPINNAVHLNAPQMLPISGNIQYAQVNISIFK
ncbi:hypothetical protein F5879DRAFT_996080 [Lentinula edodes]|nr:hypothetical protein F5879DRAFT_996080 [Lentinula edodes]